MNPSKHTQTNEPVHFEIERKFLIEYPDIDWLESHLPCSRAEITQTYLKCDPDEEIRVREKIEGDRRHYFHTAKRKISGIKRIEIEREIQKDEYERFLADADPAKRQICKTRYRFLYKNQCIEIDLYPFWQDKAIAEIELRDENDPVFFPQEIKVIKEVTHDKAYKNASLAKKDGKEYILITCGAGTPTSYSGVRHAVDAQYIYDNYLNFN